MVERGAGRLVTHRDVTTFPAVREDIGVVVSASAAAGAVVETIRAAGAPLLASVEVFDVYQGAQIEEGRKSIALHLEFRAPDRTLTDEEVFGKRHAIEEALIERFKAELRA